MCCVQTGSRIPAGKISVERSNRSESTGNEIYGRFNPYIEYFGMFTAF